MKLTKQDILESAIYMSIWKRFKNLEISKKKQKRKKQPGQKKGKGLLQNDESILEDQKSKDRGEKKGKKSLRIYIMWFVVGRHFQKKDIICM